jgi:orotate phosphoribosyltransferase
MINSILSSGQIASESDILSVLEEAGAILRHGHFVCTSGEHTPTYIEKRRLLSDPRIARFLACQIKHRLQFSGDIETVAGPEHGATKLAQLVAEFLTESANAPVVAISVPEKNGKRFIRPEDLPAVQGRMILLVEDVLTTGGTAAQSYRALGNVGGIVLGIAVLFDRNTCLSQEIWSELNDHFALISQPVPLDASYPRCSLCRKNIPISLEAGHGVEFLLDLHREDPERAEALGYNSIPPDLRDPQTTP